MNAERLAHRGVVRAIDGNDALVAVDTGGCGSCSHGSRCGLGHLAAGRAATVLRVPAQGGVRAGDTVRVSVPLRALTIAAVLGYVLPALFLLVGAGVGHAAGSDLSAALGAAGGFFGAMALGRLLIVLIPGLRATPQLDSDVFPTFSKEFHHD